ncbi:MAG: helix-turn-helix transcriptional regulator [Clostridiales bacterium]|nr:helix-turn-helix transcriptional regulator [Roseburia sp.]MDD7635382.1 helix-turn-helix transcriptional regulator [Clostridiales bacterium]
MRKHIKFLPIIAELRHQHNYSQEFVADYLGISLDYYRYIETINGGAMRMDTAEKMAMLYNTTIETIAGW